MKNFDAVIAGGGIIGAAIALELAEAGLRVGLFDAREPGREASWASAGMIAPAPEGAEAIPLVPMSMASVALYPEFIRNVEELSGMDTGYRKDGALEVAFDDESAEALLAGVALQHKLGLKAEVIRPEQARKMEPSLSGEIKAAAHRENEASVNARAFTWATLKAAQRKGVEIFAGNGAKALWNEGGRCKGLLVDKGQVEAKWTVIAAGCFSARIDGVARYAPVFPAKGQMIALRCGAVEITHALWMGHSYLVPRNDGRIIAGATIERTGFEHNVTAGGVRTILNEVTKMVPALEKARIEETWAGLRPDSPDHLPILGPTDVEGLLIATGHFRSGILWTPITARMIREWVTTGKTSVDWKRLSPMRFPQTSQKQSA
ncbi:MAG TPA: glycine oxidase ThiO [Candidatus Acidoferrum sp.]|nr:glycine oxidase ThiO [Candidatus Acidoferrum sp.]